MIVQKLYNLKLQINTTLKTMFKKTYKTLSINLICSYSEYDKNAHFLQQSNVKSTETAFWKPFQNIFL